MGCSIGGLGSARDPSVEGNRVLRSVYRAVGERSSLSAACALDSELPRAESGSHGCHCLAARRSVGGRESDEARGVHKHDLPASRRIPRTVGS
jgi:hypothetical protein